MAPIGINNSRRWFDGGAFHDSPDVTIYGKSGSYAESFAMA